MLNEFMKLFVFRMKQPEWAPKGHEIVRGQYSC